MGNVVSVTTTNSLQNIGSPELLSASRQLDRLSMEKKQIENNKNLTDKQREDKLNQIEQEIDSITQEMNHLEEKSTAQKKAKEQKEQEEQITKMFDPKTADILLQMQKLMETATKSELSESDLSSEDTDVSALSDTTSEETVANSAQADSSATGNSTIGSPLADDDTESEFSSTAGNSSASENSSSAGAVPLQADNDQYTTLEDLWQALKDREDGKYSYEDSIIGYFVDEKK